MSRIYIILLLISVACSDRLNEEGAKDIDLNNWRITLPVDVNNDGKADSYGPDEMYDALATGSLKPYFYKADDGALVFFCEVNSDIATTPNSSYPRSELREHMIPNDYDTNWNLDKGGKLKGKLQVSRVSEGARLMVMQIHGRLTDEQRDIINKDDNDAPPLLKIYYNAGQIEVAYKVLTDESLTGDDLLIKSNWTDADHYFFPEEIGNEVFELEISALNETLTVKLNGNEAKFVNSDLAVYHFDNYFKAGNYLNSKVDKAFSEVKYYQLEIEH